MSDAERSVEPLTIEQLENYVDGLLKVARFNESLMDVGPCEERDKAHELRKKARNYHRELQRRKEYGYE